MKYTVYHLLPSGTLMSKSWQYDYIWSVRNDFQQAEMMSVFTQPGKAVSMPVK